MSALFVELDHLRAWILRFTLQFEPTRKIFISRARRLFVFVTLSFIVNFLLALSVPIALLVLGPLLFGVTHLFSSFRFVPKALSEDETAQARASRLIGFFVLGVGGIRLLQLRFVTIPNFFGLGDIWEWFALLASFISLASLFRFQKKITLVSLVPLVPLMYCSWFYPLITAAVFMVGHNFVPFVYWVKLSKKTEEKGIAIALLVVFALIHVAMLIGLTDHLMSELNVSLPNFALSFNPLVLAQQILPSSMNFILLERVLSMFAFGQAVHYFLWIKVIPEATIRQEVPLTFTQSKKAILRDLGFSLSGLAFFGGTALIGLTLFFDVGILRDVYVTGVTAHGYAEIAALPLLFLRKA